MCNSMLCGKRILRQKEHTYRKCDRFVAVFVVVDVVFLYVSSGMKRLKNVYNGKKSANKRPIQNEKNERADENNAK